MVPMPVAVPTTAKPTNPHIVSRWPKDQFLLSQAQKRSWVMISHMAGSSLRGMLPVAPQALVARRQRLSPTPKASRTKPETLKKSASSTGIGKTLANSKRGVGAPFGAHKAIAMKTSMGSRNRNGQALGLATSRPKKPGKANCRMASFRNAPSTSPGRAPRGHWVVQVPQLWHSQSAGSPRSCVFKPPLRLDHLLPREGCFIRRQLANHRAGGTLIALLQVAASRGHHVPDESRVGLDQNCFTPPACSMTVLKPLIWIGTQLPDPVHKTVNQRRQLIALVDGQLHQLESFRLKL